MRLRTARTTLLAVLLAVPVILGSAHADPVVELADDTAATVTDTLADLLAGCSPAGKSWTPIDLTFTPSPTPNGSIYYRETSGGKVDLGCAGTGKIVVRIRDDIGVPGPQSRLGREFTTSFTNSRYPSGTGYVDVPYFGPDALVIRPFGKVTVNVKVYRKLSTGRYAPIPNGCMEWHYLLQPAASIVQTLPTGGPCAYSAVFLAEDAAAGIGQDETITSHIARVP